MIKYEIEKYLETLQQYNNEINDLKEDYRIYKIIKHTFPSKECSNYLNDIIFTDYNKVNYGPFSIKFLLLLTDIKNENNKKLGIKEMPYTF